MEIETKEVNEVIVDSYSRKDILLGNIFNIIVEILLRLSMIGYFYQIIKVSYKSDKILSFLRYACRI